MSLKAAVCQIMNFNMAEPPHDESLPETMPIYKDWKRKDDEVNALVAMIHAEIRTIAQAEIVKYMES